MAYTHSHHCWVAIAPVRGVETHQRWDAVRHEDGRAELRLAGDRAMHRGDVAGSAAVRLRLRVKA